MQIKHFYVSVTEGKPFVLVTHSGILHIYTKQKSNKTLTINLVKAAISNAASMSAPF